MFDGTSRLQPADAAASKPDSQGSDTVITDLRHVVFALSDALDLVGIDDLAHGKRVGIMAAECARAQGAEARDIARTFDLGLLHDVGVSSTVTHGHLVAEFDWENSQVHCEVGHALLQDFAPLAWMALPSGITTRAGSACRGISCRRRMPWRPTWCFWSTASMRSQRRITPMAAC